MADLIKYLKATQSFIASVPSGPLQEAAYAKQHHAILRLVGQTRLSIEVATEANELLAQIFAGRAELPALQAQVCSSCGAASPSESSVGRKGLQDYCNISAYLTEKLWSTLASSGADSLEAFLVHCIALGLSAPSEPTMQFLTVLYCIMHYGMERIHSMTLQSRLEIVKGVKQHFRRIYVRSQQAIAGMVHVLKLPASLVEFRTQYPQWYAQAFPVDEPVQSRIAQAELLQAVAMFPMRITRSVESKVGPLLSQQVMPQVPQMQQSGQQRLQMNFLQDGAQQFAVTMMQQMQQMQQTQQATLQVLTQLTRMQSRGCFEIGEDSLPKLEAENPNVLKPAQNKLQLGISELMGSSGSQLRVATPQQKTLALPGPAAQPPERPEASKVPAQDDKPEEADRENSASSKPPVAKRTKLSEPKSVDDAMQSMIDAMSSKESAKKASKVAEKASKAPKSMAKKKAPAAAKAKSKPCSKRIAGPGSEKVPVPFWCWERSRSQIMTRTGLKGSGQSKAIKYSKGGEAEAEKQANKWLAAERKKRGL